MTDANDRSGLRGRLEAAALAGDASLVSDADLLHGEFEDALASVLADGDPAGFLLDVFRRSSTRISVLSTEVGPVELRTDVFLCPVVGLDGALVGMLSSDEDFAFLATSFRAFGLAGAESATMLLRGAIGPEAASRAGSGDLARAAASAEEAVASGVEGLDADLAEDGILAALGAVPAHRIGTPADATLVLRWLVGARTAASRNGGPVPDDAVSGDGDPDAESLWSEEISRRFSGRGIGIGLPAPWAEATSMGACMYVAAILERARAVAGIPAGVLPDDQHRFHDREKGAISVSMRYGAEIVGPATVPAALVAKDLPTFVDALSSMAPRIVHHGSLRSLETCRVLPAAS